ncbi:MAG TPA: ATP-binding cassette domain-containing protein, partial [Flexilinea sp.]|nr:ATP-binding cassette domain-containing protein [Flexilinea sp.]
MLQLKDISYQYEKTPLLENLNLHLADHEILCLLGKSGSGKSTLLRIIAGLEKPDHGDIFWNGVSILNVPPFKRNFGLMFQDYALFP